MNAELCFSHGLELAQKGEALQALEFFRQAISLKPDYAEAYNGMGALLINMNKLNDETEFYLQRALELKSDYPEAFYNLGTLFSRTGLLHEAEICLREAISLRLDLPLAHFRLGMVLKQMNRLAESETHFCRAMELDPNFKEADFALGVLYLLQGKYEKGWKRYELRRQIFESFDPNCTPWKIEDAVDGKIVLFHEQGFGDTIHFVRYAQEIAKVASKVVLLVPRQLERLLSISFKDITILTDEMVGEHTHSSPLPSLPFRFNTMLHTIPNTIPYIKTSDAIIGKWKGILEQAVEVSRFKVGVVWTGNPNHKNDKNRSIPFQIVKQIFSIKEVTWVNLQVDNNADDLEAISDEVINFHYAISDFADTAGLIENMSLVITVDTAVAHLAGAMGKETWLLLSIDPDWRWQSNGQDSLWYPTIRIFRQTKSGDWQEVLTRVMNALEDKIKNI